MRGVQQTTLKHTPKAHPRQAHGTHDKHERHAHPHLPTRTRCLPHSDEPLHLPFPVSSCALDPLRCYPPPDLSTPRYDPTGYGFELHWFAAPDGFSPAGEATPSCFNAFAANGTCPGSFTAAR